MRKESSKDFHIEDADGADGPANSGDPRKPGADKPDIPVVRFRNRPRRQASNKTTLLIGGAALVIVIILLLRLF
jgi:hypothetical protein